MMAKALGLVQGWAIASVYTGPIQNIWVHWWYWHDRSLWETAINPSQISYLDPSSYPAQISWKINRPKHGTDWNQWQSVVPQPKVNPCTVPWRVCCTIFFTWVLLWSDQSRIYPAHWIAQGQRVIWHLLFLVVNCTCTYCQNWLCNRRIALSICERRYIIDSEEMSASLSLDLCGCLWWGPLWHPMQLCPFPLSHGEEIHGFSAPTPLCVAEKVFVLSICYWCQSFCCIDLLLVQYGGTNLFCSELKTTIEDPHPCQMMGSDTHRQQQRLWMTAAMCEIEIGFDSILVCQCRSSTSC